MNKVTKDIINTRRASVIGEVYGVLQAFATMTKKPSCSTEPHEKDSKGKCYPRMQHYTYLTGDASKDAQPIIDSLKKALDKVDPAKSKWVHLGDIWEVYTDDLEEDYRLFTFGCFMPLEATKDGTK